MPQIKKIQHAYRLIQKSNYQKAISVIHKVLETNPDNLFGVWYLGAICYIYLNHLNDAQEYINKAKEISPTNTYILLIQAYLHTINNQVSQAVYIWVDLAQKNENLIAKKLLEKTRKNKNMYLFAKQNSSPFFVLPDIHIIFPQSQYLKIHTNKRIYVIILFFILILFLGYWILTQKTFFIKNIFLPLQKTTQNIEELQLTHAHVVKNLSSNKYLFFFANPKQILSDFQKSKKLITNKQVNQARFLLQRILFSNASFSTKEQVKIFLNFIPHISFDDFSKTISSTQVFQNFPFYQNSQVLWKTKVLHYKKETRGHTFQLEKEENKIIYKITAFLPKSKNSKNWFYKSAYPHKKEGDSFSKSDAFIFGVTRSLLDKQNIYIELDSIWY